MHKKKAQEAADELSRQQMIIGMKEEIDKIPNINDKIKFLENQIKFAKSEVKKKTSLEALKDVPIKAKDIRPGAKRELSKDIQLLEAMLNNLKDKKAGRLEKKSLPPSQPAPSAVDRALAEIGRKSGKIPPEKEVDFVKNILKDKSREVIKNDKVIAALREAVPDFGKSELFMPYIEGILKEKKSKEKK